MLAFVYVRIAMRTNASEASAQVTPNTRGPLPPYGLSRIWWSAIVLVRFLTLADQETEMKDFSKVNGDAAIMRTGSDS